MTVFPPGHREISRGLTVFTRVLLLRGKAAEAEPLLREAFSIARKFHPKDNGRTAKSKEARSVLERCLAARPALCTEL